MRHYSLADKICLQFDVALKTLHGQVRTTGRADPADTIEEVELTTDQQRHAAGLMRVNHVGEICAQALYQGQALTAKTDHIRHEMQQAAAEENDHLQWCNNRLTALNSHPSYLNPLWYTASFAMGALAGWLGDQWSLGFVVETEKQVEQHLAEHLAQLPDNDQKSRAIVAQMKIDEANHAANAQAHGAAELPEWIKTIMRYKAKVMTTTAYWL